MTKGEKLYNARMERGYTRAQVEKLSGINDKLLFKYEKDIITNIPLENLEKLCDLYGINPSYVVGWEDSVSSIGAIASKQFLNKHGITDYDVLKKMHPEKIDTIIQGSVTGGIHGYNPPDTPRQYPFIPNAVAAGIPCSIEGVKELPTIGISDALMGKYAGNKHIVIMRVNGDSMNRVIPNGSFVAVKTDVDVTQLKDGDMVVFGKEHEYSLKHYYDAGEKVIFKPNSTNQTFTDHVYSKGENVCIIGKVVMSIRNYN